MGNNPSEIRHSACSVTPPILATEIEATLLGVPSVSRYLCDWESMVEAFARASTLVVILLVAQLTPLVALVGAGPACLSLKISKLFHSSLSHVVLFLLSFRPEQSSRCCHIAFPGRQCCDTKNFPLGLCLLRAGLMAGYKYQETFLP